MAKKKATKSTNKDLKYWIIGIVIAVIILGLALNYSSDSSTSRQEGELGSFIGNFFGEGDECVIDTDCENGILYFCDEEKCASKKAVEKS